MRNRKTAEGDVFIATFNEKNRTVSDDHLAMIFSAVGARHGYEDVGPNSQPLKISRSDGRGPTTGSASPSPTTSTGRPTTYSVDDAEKQKFMAAFKELNPDWKPDEDSILYDEDAPYKGFLYQKALGRF